MRPKNKEECAQKIKNMKTNLVIGSDGFIGTPFCKFLEEKSEKVIRFDIKHGESEDARIEKLPLTSVEKVYFLAWDVGGSRYLYEPKLQKNQLDWNLTLMKNVFDQLEKSKKIFSLFRANFRKK